MSTVTTPPAPAPPPPGPAAAPAGHSRTAPSPTTASSIIRGASGAWSTATTPGWYRFVGAVLIAVVVAFATLATTATFITRSSALAIRSNTAPSLIAVQGLSASVAEANAAATAVFLSGTTGVEDRTRRVQYLDALGRSAVQTEEIAGLVGDDDRSHDALQEVSVALVEYSGEIEASRTANAAGQAGADARLRAALDLAQGRIADAVGTVTAQNQQRFDDEAGTGLVLAIVAIVVGLLAVAGLVWFQIGVFRRSNRVLNVALVVATLFVAATVVSIANGLANRALALDNAETGGYDSIAATSRLQASANELQSELSLRLVGAGGGEVGALVDEIETGISGIVSDADSSRERAAAEELSIRWARYRQTAESIASLSDRGTTEEAIEVFQGAGLSSFNGLNTSIESVLSDNRNQFEEGVDAAAGAVDLLPLFSVVLPALAAVAIVFGVQGRLREYQ